MTTVIILIILACALPETSASIVSASRPCPLAVTVTQVPDVDGVDGGDGVDGDGSDGVDDVDGRDIGCDCDPGAAP